MEEKRTGILLIDAPSGFGKTQYIRKLGATSANTLTSEQLSDYIVQMVRAQSSVEETAEKLKRIYYLENLESLCGQPETQKAAARLVQAMAAQRHMVLTGIDFRKKLPFFLAALTNFRHLYLDKDSGCVVDTPI